MGSPSGSYEPEITPVTVDPRLVEVGVSDNTATGALLLPPPAELEIASELEPEVSKVLVDESVVLYQPDPNDFCHKFEEPEHPVALPNKPNNDLAARLFAEHTRK